MNTIYNLTIDDFKRDYPIAYSYVNSVLDVAIDDFREYIKTVQSTNKRGQTFTGKVAGGNLLTDSRGSLDIKNKNELSILLSYPFYGKYVDGGRRPKKKAPPSNIVEAWMELKGRNHFVRRVSPKDQKKVMKQIVFLIARSIGVNGIKGIFFIKRFKQHFVNSKFKLELSNAISKDLVNILSKKPII